MTNPNPNEKPLLADYDPETATDTEKVNALLTIMNVATDARNEATANRSENPIQNLMNMLTLTVEVLDYIEWALNIETKVPKQPDQPGYRPAS